MLDLRWRPRAQLDRESIALYLGVEQGQPQAALNVIAAIDRAIQHVREFPDSGGHYSADILQNEYRTIHAGSYTIFYRYDARTVTVWRILHQRQDIGILTPVDF